MRACGSIVIAVMMVLSVGCGGKKDEGGGGGGGGGGKAKPKVALELTGALTLSLSGEDGECHAGAGGLKTARSFSMHAGQLGAPEGFNLDLNGLTDGADDGSEGATFVRLADGEFLRTPGASTKVSEANLFTVDSTLKDSKSDRTLVVKGTVQCP